MPSRPNPSLWPREHGAYAQLAAGLASAFALAPALRGLAQLILTAAVFLASEPLLVLLGRRGPGAAAGVDRGRARGRLAALGIVGLVSGSAAWIGDARSMAGARALLPAGVLGLGLFGLFLARRERTVAGEVLAAWTFAAAALPVAVAGGAPGPAAVRLALILAALFTLGTALVHGHLLALRHGGASASRAAAFGFGAVLTGAARLAETELLPPWAFLTLLPMTLAALGIWLVPPAPRRLKAVGWAAAACALAGGALAVACLKRAGASG